MSAADRDTREPICVICEVRPDQPGYCVTVDYNGVGLYCQPCSDCGAYNQDCENNRSACFERQRMKETTVNA